MHTYSLTPTRFKEGIWEGIVARDSADTPPPEVAVTLRDRAVEGVRVTEGDSPNRWLVQVPVPIEALGDGVQTFVLRDPRTDTKLGHFTFIAGEALADDIRVEVELLRAELDMLKRAFRRHCLETL